MSRPTGSLTGELGLVGLFDLGQLLMLNRATGCLAVQSEDRKGYLYFRDGRVVNALDDAHNEGERAAHKVFSWRSGTFEFRPEPVDVDATIDASTDGLMLEAARRLDETALESSDPATTGETARIREHRAAVEALRDAFQQVARDVHPHDAAAGSPTPDLEALAVPGDRLVYRAGHPARLRQRRAWHLARDASLMESEYEELRLQLLKSCMAKSLVASGASPTRRIALADGRSVALEFVNEGPDEALWLRPVDLPPPDPSRLQGDEAALDDVLDSAQGVILVGGPTLETTRRLLHALVASLSDRFSATMLLVSADDTYRHREGPSVILKTLPETARAALRAVQPEFLVLDPAVGAGEIGLDELEAVPCILGAVVGTDASSLVPRWIARNAGGDRARASACFGPAPLALIVADQDADDEAELVISVRSLSAEERAAAVYGDALPPTPPRPRDPELKLHRS